MYAKEVTCNDGTTAEWNNSLWGLVNVNSKNSKISCNVDFGETTSLEEFIKNNAANDNDCSKTGIVEVTHGETTLAAHFQATEYRYCGENPNNYINFDNSLWRIIGLVNTPEGQRVKIVKVDSIGTMPFDKSLPYGNSTYNESTAIDDYNKTSLQIYLNNTYYSEMGSDKEMIDTVTWNLGGLYTLNIRNASSLDGQVYVIYKNERGTNVISGNQTTWKGKIGLIYISDYGYSTGGSTSDRSSCIYKPMFGWKDDTKCINNSWLRYYDAYVISGGSNDNSKGAYYFTTAPNNFIGYYWGARNTYPAVYLTSGIEISGQGTMESPYDLTLKKQ